MDVSDLEKLGLNKNEAKVYLGLLKKGQSVASELVKLLGVHRNIVYDNLEKLIEKGLVSYVVEGTKRKFIAEDPTAVIEFLDQKSKRIDNEIDSAKKLVPEIRELLEVSKEKQDASLFRGVKGVKKILGDILNSKEYWIIGVSNASVEVLGETYWQNFNIKRKSRKIREHLLLNADFRDIVGIGENKLSDYRRLPPEISQVTEFIVYDNKVAIFVYTDEPTAVLIENPALFVTFKQQFEFLWKLSGK